MVSRKKADAGEAGDLERAVALRLQLDVVALLLVGVVDPAALPGSAAGILNLADDLLAAAHASRRRLSPRPRDRKGPPLQFLISMAPRPVSLSQTPVGSWAARAAVAARNAAANVKCRARMAVAVGKVDASGASWLSPDQNLRARVTGDRAGSQMQPQSLKTVPSDVPRETGWGSHLRVRRIFQGKYIPNQCAEKRTSRGS